MENDTLQPRTCFKLKMWHIFLALVLLLLFCIILFRLTTSSSLNRKIEEMQQAGYPTNPEEFDEYCKIPEGVTNAADTYNEAFLNYIPLDPIYKNLVPFVGSMTYSYEDPPLSAECIDETELFLTQNKNTLKLLHEAGFSISGRGLSEFLFGVDFNKFTGFFFFNGR